MRLVRSRENSSFCCVATSVGPLRFVFGLDFLFALCYRITQLSRGCRILQVRRWRMPVFFPRKLLLPLTARSYLLKEIHNITVYMVSVLRWRKMFTPSILEPKPFKIELHHSPRKKDSISDLENSPSSLCFISSTCFLRSRR